MSEDELIGVCSECHSDQRDDYIERNPFYQQGGRVPCQYCSGLVIIVTRGNRENALRQVNRERGLPER